MCFNCGDVVGSRFRGFSTTNNHTANAVFCQNNTHHDACDACYSPITDSFDGTTTGDVFHQNMRAMKIGDHATVFLAAAMVAFEAITEMEDITGCQILLGRASERAEGACERRLLTVVMWLRNYLLLPLICASVPILIIYRGADALTICFNCVATVFILKCDDMALSLLDTRFNRELEAQRCELTNANVKTIDITKKVHFVAIATGLPMCLQHFYASDIIDKTYDGTGVIFFPFVIFLVAGLMTVALRAAGPDESKALACGIVVAKWFFGLVMIVVTQLVVFTLNHHTVEKDFGLARGIHYVHCTEEEIAADLTGADCDMDPHDLG